MGNLGPEVGLRRRCAGMVPGFQILDEVVMGAAWSEAGGDGTAGRQRRAVGHVF
jgi:hypothetical protein